MTDIWNTHSLRYLPRSVEILYAIYLNILHIVVQSIASWTQPASQKTGGGGGGGGGGAKITHIFMKITGREIDLIKHLFALCGLPLSFS